jgi:hypothetical protein
MMGLEDILKKGQQEQPQGSKSELNVGLCAVLTYKDSGHRGVGGQTVGADGSGEYAVIFDAETSEKAAVAATEYIREIDKAHPGRISEVHLVYGAGYMGPYVKMISA